MGEFARSTRAGPLRNFDAGELLGSVSQRVHIKAIDRKLAVFEGAGGGYGSFVGNQVSQEHVEQLANCYMGYRRVTITPTRSKVGEKQ